jgi:hypothetical protein
MSEKDPKRMQCSQFEALLPDVLDSDNDGRLSAEVRQAFHDHAQGCAVCGPLFAEAREGMLWLRTLEEVQPPESLVHNILAATSAAESERAPAQARVPWRTWIPTLWKPVRSFVAMAMQPRFATSFSMAFFSLSLILTLGGVRLKDLAHVDWHPSALGKAVVLQYTQVESKVVRYYNNMRLVYEIESRVGELKKAEQKNEKHEQPAPEKKKKDNNNTSGRPDQRQDNYSQETEYAAFAYLTHDHQGANQ